MIEVFTTDEFERRYRELPEIVKKRAKKQESLFRENPFYPSLSTEKLQPKNKETWSFRIDSSYRVFSRFIGPNKVLLLTVGPHDWIYKLFARYP